MDTRGEHNSIGSIATDLFRVSGEMASLMRATDWSKTGVGPVETWPQSLRVVVRILLTSRYAMWLGWGKELTFFYNDAYAPTLGVKHPWALGRPAWEVWEEIWPDIGPRIDKVIRTGEATWDEALLLFLERSGYQEETYHTFSYGPVPDDGGQVGGMLCVVTEETERVIGERRLALLRELGTDLAATSSEEEVFSALSRRIEARPQDLPFALVYLFDAPFDGGTRSARLACACGAEAGDPVAPTSILMTVGDGDGDGAWPAESILSQGGPVLVDSLGDRFGALPSGPWDKPARQAVLVSIASQGQEQPAGFLVAAINPYRSFDVGYQGFLDLLAGQIASSVSNARAYEVERRRAEALAELDRAKTAFFSNVSHEFRTPLTLMLGPLEDILGKPENEDMPDRDLLEVVRRNSLRLQKLVNVLLDFARIEAGRVQAIYEPTDLAAFTAELASNFRSASERAGLELVVDCTPLPEPVYVDRDMWEKIVLNLLSNAVKFTFRGRIEVALRQAGPSVELAVRDTGTGIPADQIPHLFERFHRVEGARGRTQEGSGIGLALVRELVRLHGGNVEAESRPGEGSTFLVTLPLGTSHLPAERISATRPQLSAAQGAIPYVEEALRWLPETNAVDGLQETSPPARSDSGDRPRILLADDNADMRDYVRRLLAGSYEVSAVADGLAALQSARERVPDLVLTDVMMPGLDGFGLLKELRATPGLRQVPVILLSARAGQEARVEGLQAGADDYLTKPFNARELLARVDGTLQLARLRQETQAAVRESQERMRLAIDAAAITTWTWDIQSNRLYGNDQLTRLFSVTSDGEAGAPLDDYTEAIHPDDWPLVSAALSRSMEDGDAGDYEAEYRIFQPDGSIRWVVARGRVERDGAGRPLRMPGVLVDITERKHLEEALRERAEELAEADRRKDEFLATLAHELRNPLAPIRSSLHILRSSGDGKPADRRLLDMMERQVGHMVRLVDDLLEISRITRGKIELRPETAEVQAIIRSAVDTSRPLLDAAHHELEISVPPDPILVEADPVRLSQVIANLLNNAAKYTPEGGRISLAAFEEDGEVVIAVRDTGVGIPTEMLPRVFELFTQVDRTRKHSQGGLGIGLALVKSLVEMHHGRVEARSEGTGEGSEFVVRLPLLAASSGALGSAAPTAGPRDERPPGRRVLIVDDNRDAAESLALLLQFSGYDVQTANDGLSAVRAMDDYRPAVVLLDIGMPGMDGYEVARRVRTRPDFSDVVLVALTGWGQDADRRRSTEAGFDRHLVKPVDPEVLRGLLASLGQPEIEP
jgi:PAS domain S-box-containing protein